MRPEQAPNDPSGIGQDAAEELLVRFDRTWKNGSAPRIEEFLPAAGTASHELLAELVMIDLEYRWRQAAQERGSPIPRPLEEYVANFPELGEPNADLIAEEYRARQRWGDRPGHDEYLRRFPARPDQVKEVLTRVDTELAAEPAGKHPLPPSNGPALESVSGLLDALRRYGILDARRLNALVLDDLQHRFADARWLGKELLQRGWLTAFQVNQLLQGKGADLQLGAYLLLERLGDGAKGQVFKAWHQRMARLAAVKVIRPELLADPEAVRRFYKEIEAASRLTHPHVVHAYDAGPCGPTHFLAMEYVEGIDLNRLVKEQGPLPADQACDYIRQAALGLQYIHEHGLVHRDIKPANLMVTENGEPRTGKENHSPASFPVPPSLVKILDLGLARLPRLADGEATSILTQEGAVMGTPDYMAPEQANDPHAVDIRADLYSLGCTFYYLLSGRAPFPGGTLFQKADRHRWEEPPSLERLCPEVPATPAAVVRKLLAKRPEDRFQTPVEVADILAQIDRVEASTLMAGSTPTLPYAIPVRASDATLVSRPPAPARRKRRSLVIGALLVVLLPILWLLGAHSGPQPVAVRNSTPDSKPIGVSGSPLFRLSAADIPPPELSATEHPKGLVAVLGEHRWRHWQPIRCLAVSPDGRIVVSGGDDQVLRVWDNGRETYNLSKHNSTIQAVAFAPSDSKKIASGDRDGKIWIWDLENGAKSTALPGHKKGVLSLSFSPDGKQLASGGADNRVRLWDLGTDKELPSPLPEFPGPVRAAFSPKGRTLAIGYAQEKEKRNKTGFVELWDVAKGQQLASFPGHANDITALAFAPDGRTLASGSWGGTAPRLWDIAGREEVGPFQGNGTGPILCLAFAPDGMTIASGSAHNMVKLWDVAARRQLPRPLETTGRIWGIAFTPDNKTVIAGGGDGVLRQLDVENRKERSAPRGHTAAARAVVFSPDDAKLISASDDYTIKIWDMTARGREPISLQQHSEAVVSLALTDGGKRLASAGWDGMVRLWDWDKQKELARLDYKYPRIRAVAISPDGLILAASGDDSKIRLFSVPEARQLYALTGQTPRPVVALAFSPKNGLLASAGWDRAVRLWKITPKEGLEERSPWRTSGATNRITALAFSPDGNTLAWANANNENKDGKSRLVGIVKLWDMTNNKELERGDSKHLAPITSLVFAPDGQTLVSADEAGQIHWETLLGQLRGSWQLPGIVHGLAFAADGRHLATANGNGTVYVLRLTPVPPLSARRSERVR